VKKELAANTTLSHYRIVSKIGAGGMGVVYLAQDTRLDRKVALKLLLFEFISNEDRLRRFVQEAKAAQLGRGGMGEVYSARDARLNRHVAIKNLPAWYNH
jgi:serine/threonine protein kinase